MTNFTRFLFVIASLHLISASSSLLANEGEYLREFKTGMELYQVKQYEDADQHFRNSFELKKHPKTAYFIADSNFELQNYVAAKTFANLALYELKPELEDDKKDYLKKIISKIDDRAIRKYRAAKSTIKYSLTLSKNDLHSLDPWKIQAMEANYRQQLLQARNELVSLGIDPDEVENSILMLVPDKCDPNNAGQRTPEELNKCMAEMFY